MDQGRDINIRCALAYIEYKITFSNFTTDCKAS